MGLTRCRFSESVKCQELTPSMTGLRMCHEWIWPDDMDVWRGVREAGNPPEAGKVSADRGEHPPSRRALRRDKGAGRGNVWSVNCEALGTSAIA